LSFAGPLATPVSQGTIQPVMGHSVPVKAPEEAPKLRLIKEKTIQNQFAPSVSVPVKRLGQTADRSNLGPQLDTTSVETPQSDKQALSTGITQVRVTRGRSQIVKFAQPIKRLSIAEPTLADLIPLSPTEIMINGKQRGVTSLVVWDEFGQEGLFDLYVENDTSELLQAVKAIAPTERFDARITDDSFIISGQISSSVILDEIRRLASAYGYRNDHFVDLTETPVPQVYLKVRIAEATRTATNELRVSFSYVHDKFSFLRLGNEPSETTGPGNQVNVTSTNIGGLLTTISPTRSLDIILDALETSGKISVLAEPNLVCTHGRTADFLAGGEFPFITGISNNGMPIITFKEYGVKLKFTPWLAIRSGRIELKVEPEVSSLDTSNCLDGLMNTNIRICGLLKRTTSTTVELKDGETLMISGILSREEQNAFQKIPFIGELPIIGVLFRNSQLNKADRELVVIVTPTIVKPSDYGKILGGPS
jgi:pilus assembly protein CpaC